MAVVTLDPPSLEVRHRQMGVGLACSRRGRSDWRAWTWARVRPRFASKRDCQAVRKSPVRKVKTKPSFLCVSFLLRPARDGFGMRFNFWGENFLKVLRRVCATSSSGARRYGA